MTPRRNSDASLHQDPGNGSPKVNGKPDPTVNVRELVAFAVDRLDDLRDAERVRVNEAMQREREHMRELLSVRAEYGRELVQAEAKRIDAIRAVDVNAVSVASERAAAQATVLANQVASSAEALRALVATTAATQSAATSQLTSQLTDRLASLEKAQYEGKGRAGVTDPAMDTLAAEMRAMRLSVASGAGAKEGSKATIAYIIAAVTVGIAIVTFLMRLP